MKTKEVGKKLRISKETVSNLDNQEMDIARGGGRSDPTECPVICSWVTNCMTNCPAC